MAVGYRDGASCYLARGIGSVQLSSTQREGLTIDVVCPRMIDVGDLDFDYLCVAEGVPKHKFRM